MNNRSRHPHMFTAILALLLALSLTACDVSTDVKIEGTTSLTETSTVEAASPQTIAEEPPSSRTPTLRR